MTIGALFLLEAYLYCLRGRTRIEYYACKAYSRFIRYYNRRRYEDAAVWGRRLAEAVCITIIGRQRAEGELLGGMLGILWYDRLLAEEDTAYGIINRNGDEKILHVAMAVGHSEGDSRTAYVVHVLM